MERISDRRTRALLALALLPALVAASAAVAQTAHTENTLRLDDPAVRPQASVQSLAWLAGFWRGEGTLGPAEEVWMPPSGGTMVGAFKALQEGRSFFYEFVEISEEEGSLVLKVKHFDPDLTGWEERGDYVSFPLVRLGENEAYFSGLTYRLTGKDELRAFVAISGDDGQVTELGFEFERQEPGGES